MAQKKSFILRIDEDTFRKLEKWAVDEFRSINSQIEFLLSQALTNADRQRPSARQETVTKKSNRSSDK